MHKILIEDKMYSFETSNNFRVEMFKLRSEDKLDGIDIYVDPNIVKDDEEYFYLLSLRDKNIEDLKKKGDRYTVDNFFEILAFLKSIESYQ